jgi:CTP:molybdopterin cytidylyltransferase MocA
MRLPTCDYDQAVTRAIVLAAGLSSRMGGRPKALLPFDDRDCFVTRIVRTLTDAGISDVIVVVGHEGAKVADAVRRSGLPARVVVNERYTDGQFSSLLAGLDAAEAADTEAVLLALVDAPLFAPSTVRAVVEHFARSGAPVVRAVRGAEHGHPVLLGRALFGALRAADPALGAKPVVRGHASAAGDVSVDDPGAFIDIDTPEEYESWRATMR